MTILMVAELEHKGGGGGMVPVNWAFLDNHKYVSCVRLANVDGMVPVNWFPCKLKLLSDGRLANVDGMGPVNWFPTNHK